MPHRFARSTAFLLVAAGVTACASSSNSTETGVDDEDGGRCAFRQQDSVFVAGGPVYRACAVKTKAVLLTKDRVPDFRPTVSGNTCYSAEVEFVVDARGLPETRTARIVRTNNQAYAESILAVLPRWRFDPAKLDGVPVRQIVLNRLMAGTVTVVRVAGGGAPSALPRSARPRC